MAATSYSSIFRIRRTVRAPDFQQNAFEKIVGQRRYRWMKTLGNRSIITKRGQMEIADPSAVNDLLEHILQANDQNTRRWGRAANRPARWRLTKKPPRIAELESTMQPWDLLWKFQARELSDKPRVNAFCRVAPSLRFSVLAMLAACIFFFASFFSLRTCFFVHWRRFDTFSAIQITPGFRKLDFVAESSCKEKPKYVGS